MNPTIKKYLTLTPEILVYLAGIALATGWPGMEG